MSFDLGDYKDVAERIADFKAKHPEGCLQPIDPGEPFRVVTIGQQSFVAYTAAAYREPEDPRPGIGVAWEPFPGKTNYTRDSELQNAETSAWGRAIVAVLASESKNIASSNEVRARQEDQGAPRGPAKDRPRCTSCGEFLTGKAVKYGQGFAHEACAEKGEPPAGAPAPAVGEGEVTE